MDQPPTNFSNGKQPDRFELWPLLTALIALFLTGLMGSYSPLATILPIFGVAIAGIVALVLAALSAAETRWRYAASMMVLPVAIAATIGLPDATLRPAARLGDYIHIVLKRSAYEAKIATLKQPPGQRFTEFLWSGFLGTETVAIYDESDKIGGELSDEDERRLGGYRKCAGARHITGHYYVCTVQW